MRPVEPLRGQLSGIWSHSRQVWVWMSSIRERTWQRGHCSVATKLAYNDM